MPEDKVIMPKYRVAVQRGDGVHVAAPDAHSAALGCFPDHTLTLFREGPRWTQYKIDPPVPYHWPNSEPLKNHIKEIPTVDIVDVEAWGVILVMGSNEKIVIPK